ncbi:MAG: hypothetical protein ABI615_07430 [Chthoniobacterales bacterium]
MKTISLWQPWAQFVALGWKTIETRTHTRFNSLVGQRIAIQAAQKWDKLAGAAGDYVATPARYMKCLEIGGEYPKYSCSIVATAYVQEFRLLTPEDAPAAMIECHTKRYGLILCDVEKIFIPNIKGMQGIFNTPDELFPTRAE